MVGIVQDDDRPKPGTATTGANLDQESFDGHASSEESLWRIRPNDNAKALTLDLFRDEYVALVPHAIKGFHPGR